jgi:DNA polymerase IV
MASEFNKPNGISVLYEADVQTRIWPLPVRKINGIGPKAEVKLHKLHLHTIGDIAGQDREWLIDNFGKSYGAWMHDAAWGRDDRPVVTESEPVSMSRETTFDRDLHAVRDRVELGAIFTDLCKQVAGDLQRKGYVGKTIGIKLRYDDFKIATRDQTMEQFTADAKTIRKIAGQCLKRVPLERRLRLLGVRVGKLAKAGSPEAQAPADAPAGGVHRVAEPAPFEGTLDLF